GVSLLCWRSGGVGHPHDTPPYPFTPSPTFAHSSLCGARRFRLCDTCAGEKGVLLRRDLHLERRYAESAVCRLRPAFWPRCPHWLAQTMRAIHDTSRTCNVHSTCAGSIERSSIDFAVRRLSSFTITSPAAVLSTTRSPRRIEAAGDTMTRGPS